MLALIEQMFPVIGYCVAFLRGKMSSHLNRLFSSDVVLRKPEGKNYRRIDVVFPLIRTFVNKATGYIEAGELKKVNSLNSELVNEIFRRH